MKLTDEQRDWLALALVPGVGTVHFIRLLARYRTPGQVLRASAASLRGVVGPKLAERIANYSEAADIEGQTRLMNQYEAELITMNDPLYPTHLAEIYDPPLILFARGRLLETDERSVAIVGTRGATPYGIRMAEKFGRELAARGITVVSGMALGVDSAAHRGALEAGGRTVAVLGCGVDTVYPPRNADLMDAIARQGCVLSQFPMGVKPSKGHFPHRNRIISGMTMGTLVVQAPLRSGALITAHQALEQGREVFAIPGEVGQRNSEGPHALIREGAKLVETVEDILLELNLLDQPATGAAPSRSATRSEQVDANPAVQQPPRQSASSSEPAPRAAKPQPPAASVPPVPTPKGTEGDVLSVLSPDGSYVDEIAAACRIPVSEALSSLTLLELKGLVRQFSGKRFAKR
jgi:DNA processing protein